MRYRRDTRPIGRGSRTSFSRFAHRATRGAWMKLYMRRTTMSALALVSVMGCIPAEVVGSLRHEEDERERLLIRARGSGVSVDVLNAIVPPLSRDEKRAMQAQDNSCRASYLWKNGLSWTGGSLIAV